jgi:FkbH-like protein
LVQAYNSGILLCLCSKNNLNDVEEVFEINSNMILKRNNIIVSKCNWQEKYKNLNEIATELSLGLESFIFIDDSDFELNQMKLMLPEVKCVKVPDNIFEYTQVIDQTLSMYFNFTLTGEDRNRNLLYKQNFERESLKQNFLSIDEYLSSLKIEIVVNSNEIKYLDRISQLTQKTNQFNLTTKRYSEKEIENFIYSKNYDVYSFNVSDKFGSNGLTAIVIVEYISKSESYIDTFLMSCRIIGRNIENVILDHIVRELRSKGILILGSKYISTNKNNQVENFFEKAGFNLVDSIESIKSYSILLDEYKFSKIDYINIH